MKVLLPFVLVLGAAIAAADDAGLDQTAARQEQIRSDADGLVARLDDVITEYTRNGIANGGDFEALKAVRAALATLSDEEMEQVVQILRASGGDREQMAKAYAGQKDITVRLKQILAEHELDQDLDALASGVRQLADRQSANLSATIDTRQLAAQDTSANGQAAVTASEQAQQSEQTALAAEVRLIAEKLGQIATDSNGQAAASELVRVEPEADDAATALGAGNIDAAEPLEKTAREQLDEVARALMPVGAPEALPGRALTDLAALARQQHSLLGQTVKLNNDLKKISDAETAEATDKAMHDQIKAASSPLAKVLAQGGITNSSPPDQIRSAPEMKAWLDTRAAALQQQKTALQSQFDALAATQAALAEKAQMARDDLQKGANAAAAPIETALPQMASAQQALAAANGDQAVSQQTEAASQLDEAEHFAQQSAAAAQAASPEQQVRQLQSGVNGLATRETASVQEGDALKTGAAVVPATEAQQNMADKAQALGQAAAGAGSAAAQPLQQAADAFRKAAQLMSAGAAPMQAAAAQQAALQNLADAGRQLAQEAAGIVRQKQDLAAMAREMSGIGRLIQQQRQAGLDAERGASQKATQLTKEEAAVQKNAENSEKNLNATSPDAAAALAKADAAMNDAAQAMGGGDADTAAQRQKDALGALYQAQDSLAGQMQSAAQGLGQSFAQGRGPAAAALARAQTDAAAAQQAMASGRSGADGMRATAQQLGLAASQPQSLPQSVRDALRSASQAAAESAAAAAAGESSQAQAQAAAASQAMQAAQSAMGEDAAGIAATDSANSQEANPGGQGSNAEQANAAQQSSSGGQSNSQAQSTTAQPSGNSNQQSGKPPEKGGAGASEKSWQDQGGGAKAAENGAQGTGQFLALPDRDRAALEQSQSEKYPQEYGTMVEQYMRNLSSDTGDKPQ